MNLSQTITDHSPSNGIILIIISVFLMALQDALFKLVSGHLSLWQVYVLRSLVAVALLGFLTRHLKSTVTGIKSEFLWITLRSSLLVLMFITLYAAVPFIELATIAAGFYVSPLITTLLSALIIKESVNHRQVVGILIGFTGTLLILQPGTDQFSIIMMLPIIAALCYSLTAIITRLKLSCSSSYSLAFAINLALLLTGTVASLIIYSLDLSANTIDFAPFLLTGWQALNPNDWLTVTLLGLLGALIGITLAKAYQIGKPTVIAGFDYSYMIFAILWGYIFFAEVPTLLTLVGMALITISGLIVTRYGKPDTSS